MSIRAAIISAFSATGEYSHVLPFRRSGYVDGLFHLSMLAGAARRAGDGEVANLAANWIGGLLACGPDARNWYSVPHDGYAPAGAVWAKRSPQAFAGPAALQWAALPGLAGADMKPRARVFCALGLPFGWAIRVFSGLRQHVSSVLLAHLLLDKRPPSSMRFLAEKNPLYSWQCGVPCEVEEYPNTGPWPAKDWPGGPREYPAEYYTPVCSLVAQYLMGGDRATA